MVTLFFSTDPKITEILARSLELKKIEDSEEFSGFDLYKKAWHILCHSSTGEHIFRQAFLYAYSEYDPEVIMYVSTATKVSTEIKEWDIVLPNVFFELHKDLKSLDLSKENRDSLLSHPLFLEQYTLQNDYDFWEFGLRVGWICVTKNENQETDEETLEKIQISYEADIIDDYAYWFLDEAKKLDILDRTYVVLWAIAKNPEISFIHIVHIISFLLENLDWENLIEDDGEEDEIELLNDEDFKEKDMN
ncbi:MAG: hypothetical protein ACD_2C00244G0004 [uncultured bacterium (gcode 4)]|uniref:Uncharacterized protein n=1 Tax=uncultured bacterium (gcode 4) TaxID=1234023 RepID=K2FD35_9BACT|nr:MAG: hypothetical protein ACD_2C00244G0004 [uncultured bacterium (gcode 4)]